MLLADKSYHAHTQLCCRTQRGRRVRVRVRVSPLRHFDDVIACTRVKLRLSAVQKDDGHMATNTHTQRTQNHSTEAAQLPRVCALAGD